MAGKPGVKQAILTEDLGSYLWNHSLRENEYLKELREETMKLSHSNMLSDPNQVQFMTLLVQLIGAKRGIEGKN